jgi:hypothetical protein
MLAALREADIDRYLSLLLMPDGVRNDLLALFLFNAEIASIRDRIREACPGKSVCSGGETCCRGKGTARRRRIRSLPPLLR